MIDGKRNQQVFSALEADPYIAFDVKGTNLYFKNGVSIGKHLLSIFDDSTKVYRTYTMPIPEAEMKKKVSKQSPSMLEQNLLQLIGCLVRITMILN